MILDKQNMFSDDQAVTASAVSTNVIDLGALSDEAANYDEYTLGGLEVLAQVTADFATLTSLQVVLQTSVDAAFSSPIVMSESGAVAAADLLAGYQFKLTGKMPHGPERYIRLSYVVAGSNATAGTIVAGLIVDRQTNGI